MMAGAGLAVERRRFARRGALKMWHAPRQTSSAHVPSLNSLLRIRSRPIAVAVDVVPAATYVGVIFYTGLIRIPALPEAPFVPTDKLLHALVFGGLVWLAMRAARVLLPHATPGKRVVASVLFSSLVGASLEICQYFVPYRSAEFLDWVADTVGALLVAGLLTLLLRRDASG